MNPLDSTEDLLEILELTQRLSAPIELDRLLLEVVQAGQTILSADRVTLWLFESETQELVIRVPKIEPEIRVPFNKGIVGESFTNNQLINIEDSQKDVRFNSSADKVTGYTTHSNLSIPLVTHEGHKIGVLQMLNKKGGVFNEHDERIASVFAAQCSVALQRAQMTEKLIQQKQIEEEVIVAKQIQQSTMPTVMPDFPGYDCAGIFQPADDTGGDMFDIIKLDDKLFLLLGDATGHGFGPALSATQMHAMLRVAFRVGADLKNAYRHANNQMVEDLPDDRFVTAFIGFLEPTSNSVLYHSAGQGPILHYRAAHKSCVLSGPTSFPMGAMEIDEDIQTEVITLESGDILALISDGIYETMNEAGEEFGEQRVQALINDNAHLPMIDLAELLVREARAHRGLMPQQDDVTLVMVRRDSESAMFKRDINELSSLVEYTDNFFANHSIDASLKNTSDLLIEEIFVNMVKYNTKSDKDIRLELMQKEAGIVVRMTDFDSEPYDITEHPDVDVDAPLEERTPGGLGIYMVKHLSDKVDYQHVDGNSTITFTLVNNDV